MAQIHPTAIVSDACTLADDVQIGPGCILDGPVNLAHGVRLIANVHICGPVTIGRGTQIYPFTCIGFPGQDFKFNPGDPTAGVTIGQDCILREHVTIHAATKTDKPTTIGNRVFMMINAHVGHDVSIGNNVIMINNCVVGGHAEVQDGVNLSAGAMVHQFTRIGRLSFFTGGIGTSMDVPPFCLLTERNRLDSVNLVGMRRSGMPRDQITNVRQAFNAVLRKPTQRGEMIETLRTRWPDCPAVNEMADFIEQAKRPICSSPGRPPRSMASFLHLLRKDKPELIGTAPEDFS